MSNIKKMLLTICLTSTLHTFCQEEPAENVSGRSRPKVTESTRIFFGPPTIKVKNILKKFLVGVWDKEIQDSESLECALKKCSSLNLFKEGTDANPYATRIKGEFKCRDLQNKNYKVSIGISFWDEVLTEYRIVTPSESSYSWFVFSNPSWGLSGIMTSKELRDWLMKKNEQ